MRTQKQKNLAKIRRKLNHVVFLHGCSCGHDILVLKALDAERDLIEFVESILPTENQ